MPVLVVVLAAAIVVPLTLFDGDDTGPQPAAGEDGGGGRNAEPLPEDRDTEAVLAALRDIDPCQLLDAELLAHPDTMDKVANGPHSCTFLNRDATEYLTVRVGARSDHLVKSDSRAEAVAGAKAYWLQGHVGSPSTCTWTIPVSFTYAVELHYDPAQRGEDPDSCSQLTRFVEYMVEKLKHPERISWEDGARPPFAGWDACSLMRESFGREIPADATRSGIGGIRDPLSSCERVPVREGDNERLELRVEYGRAVTPPDERPETIAGQRVYVNELDSSCSGEWYQGPSGGERSEHDTVVVHVMVPECDDLAPVIEKVAAAKDQQVDASGVDPQDPLLYEPDGEDVAARGDCKYFYEPNGVEDCEPYSGVDPDVTGDELMAATTDRNVKCAIFKDAIAAEFGSGFSPVVWGDHCIFVREDGKYEIFVGANPAYAPAEFAAAGADSQEVSIGRFPAITYTNVEEYNIYLSPHGDVNQRGMLSIAVEPKAERGYYADDRPQLSDEETRKAQAVIQQAAETYFG